MSTLESTNSIPATLPRPSREQIGFTKLFAVCLLVPCAIVSAVLTLSPNFAETSSEVQLREHPVGGDIIQEYVGGYLWKTEPERLYDWQYSKELQHDEQLVGFAWDPSGYFPMVYPPFHYQFASVGTGLSYRSFVIAWTFASALALSFASFVFLAGYREMRVGAGGWFFIAILFTPLLLSITMGQKSTFLLAILTASFIMLHRERPLLAGLVFGLMAFKPYLALPIGLVMLCKKQHRFVIGSLITLSVLIVSSLIYSPQAWLDYLRVCLGMGDYLSTSGYQLEHSHCIWGSAHLMLDNINPTLTLPASIIAAIGLVTLVGRIMSGPIELCSPRFAFQFSSLVVATVLISPHFYTYDLTILLLPLAICGLSADVSKRVNRRLLYWICVAVLFGASIYVPVALNLGIQFSTFILFAWLIIIAGGWQTAGSATLEKFRA